MGSRPSTVSFTTAACIFTLPLSPLVYSELVFFFLYLIVIDGLETKAQSERSVPDRRSTSSSNSEASTQNLHKNPHGVTNAKNNKISSTPGNA